MVKVEWVRLKIGVEADTGKRVHGGLADAGQGRLMPFAGCENERVPLQCHGDALVQRKGLLLRYDLGPGLGKEAEGEEYVDMPHTDMH